MVGGGGAGGIQIGSGGGGGAVLYATNVSIPSNTYTISVGRGVIPGEVRGKSTEGFEAIVLGGGCANNQGWGTNTSVNGNSGGSGGGGKGGGRWRWRCNAGPVAAYRVAMRNVVYSIAAMKKGAGHHHASLVGLTCRGDQCEIPSPPPPPRHNSAIYNCPLLYRSSGALSCCTRNF